VSIQSHIRVTVPVTLCHLLPPFLTHATTFPRRFPPRRFI
jgi:hypothetical protein